PKLQQRRRAVAMRAAGAEGRRARNDLLVEYLKLGLAGLADAIQLGGEPAIAQFRWDFFGCLDQGDQKLGQNGWIESARFRNTREATWKDLAPQSACQFSRLFRRQHMEQSIANIFLEEASPFLDDDDILAALGKLRDQAHIHRIAHAHLQNRELAIQAQVGEHMVKIRPRHARHDKAQRGLARVRLKLAGQFLRARPASWNDPIDSQFARRGKRLFISLRHPQFLLPGARRQKHFAQIDLLRIECNLLIAVDRRELILAAIDRAPAVGLNGGDDVANVKPRRLRKAEAGVNPILHFLRRAGFDHRHPKMLAEKSAIRRYLSAVAPRVIAHDDDRAALRMSAGQISQSKCIGSDMHADALHDADRPAGGHLRAIDGGNTERFVISLKCANALLGEDIFDVAENVEKAGDRGTGISGEEMNAALGFERALHQEFVAGKYFTTAFGQKA